METFNSLLAEVRACRACADVLPLGPRPVVQISPTARVLIASQAPGTRVHDTGVPFSDASGDEAQKAIRVPCAGWGGMQQRAAAYAGLPTEAPTCEVTNLKIKRKR